MFAPNRYRHRDRQGKVKRDHGFKDWCPFYVGEKVWSRWLVGDWYINEIGLYDSVRITNSQAVNMEISPIHLSMYPAEEYLDA